MTDILLIALVVVYLVLTGLQVHNLRELRKIIQGYISK